MKESKRLAWVDVAKGIAIISVVVGHAKTPFMPFVYLYHIPVFFFISGMFTRGDSNFNVFFKAKIRSLYFPYIIVLLSMTVFHNVFVKMGMYPAFHSWQSFATQVAKIALFGGTLSEPITYAMWFVKSLFFSEIILYWVLRLVAKWTSRFFFVSLFSLAIFFLVYGLGYHGFSHELLIPVIALPFLLAGRFYYEVLNAMTVRFWAILLLILVVFSFAFRIDLTSLDLPNPVMYYGASFVGIFAVIGLAQTLVAVGVYRVLGAIGLCSFAIMAMHLLVFRLITFLWVRIGRLDAASLRDVACAGFTLNVAYIFLGVGIPVLLSHWLKRLVK